MTVRVGESVGYPPFEGKPDGYTLVSVNEGLFSAEANIQTRAGEFKTVKLQVRFTHPAFFLQKVAFVPS